MQPPLENPPRYDYCAVDARGGKLQRRSQPLAAPPPPQVSLAPAATTARALNAGGPPISLHVYKASGLWCKDDIITGDDKTTIQFYLNFPLQFFGGWDLTLRRGGKQGSHVASIQKGGFSGDFNFRMANGWSTVMVRTGVFSKTHQMVGFDGRTRYKWKTDGFFGGDWILINTANEDTIASWRKTGWALSKDGHLLVSQLYIGEVELILASCLAIEEWAREQQQSSSRRRRNR